ncbi:TPA: hypothetical protein N0F65_001278 [Lagenidium giganteum]|uniref:C2HC/C3H-type domain-containing protein n=1 Tax=Lagenidium giganteum TaxID=4803 RepID=A0AAV2YWY7_9STRA|nr:TPA: hypothetical protein N0F65_001278 [Lagenidium giganteum]
MASLLTRPPTQAVAGESGDQDGLFCCFCGQKQPDSAFVDHFRKCNTLNHHKSAMSPLYRRFQEFLCLLSEDASLRALHYPTAFLEPTPRTTSSNPTVQDSLRLLRPSRQSRRRALPQRSSERPDTSFTDVSTINRSGDLGFAGERQPPESNNSNPSERSTVSIRPRHSSRGSQFAEECRHCHRSFAEGRLAKHEAVCPRVFGNETTWGRPGSARHPPSYNRHLPTAHSDPPHSRKLPAKNKSLKSYRLDQRSLKTSYAMHQATLVECPCCKRKFAPSGAQQHIDICKTVQNRPKNPVKDFALAG